MMTYTKPEDIRCVDMCIYIDEHIHEANHDVELIYKYLYLIVLMLSRKNGYYTSDKIEDDFCIYCASRLYMRLTDPRQFKKNNRNIKPIKSVLNFIKKMLFPYKKDFESLLFNNETEVSTDTTTTFSNLFYDSIDHISRAEFKLTFTSLTTFCKDYLKTIPYKKYSSEYSNIYISVMLTLLSQFSFTKSQNYKLNIMNPSEVPFRTERFFSNQLYTDVKLYHLPEYFKSYVFSLTMQIRHAFVTMLKQHCDINIGMDFCVGDNLHED